MFATRGQCMWWAHLLMQTTVLLVVLAACPNQLIAAEEVTGFLQRAGEKTSIGVQEENQGGTAHGSTLIAGTSEALVPPVYDIGDAQRSVIAPRRIVVGSVVYDDHGNCFSLSEFESRSR